MGTSVMKSSKAVVAALVIVVVLLGTCASGANAALRVQNVREDGANLTLLHPPGCCTYCTGEICPTICEVCRDVVVEKGKEVTLEPDVGPYPLQYLDIKVEGEVYSVPEKNLQHLTKTALLQVGSSDDFCKAFPNSIHARIVDEGVPCRPDSGRTEICLRLCSKQKESS